MAFYPLRSKTFDEGWVEEARGILTEGLRKFPGDEVIENMLVNWKYGKRPSLILFSLILLTTSKRKASFDPTLKSDHLLELFLTTNDVNNFVYYLGKFFSFQVTNPIQDNTTISSKYSIRSYVA